MINIAKLEDTSEATSGAAMVGESIYCLENGGSGSRKADAFVPNPLPHDKTKIDIFDSSPNALNFHVTKHEEHYRLPHMGSTPPHVLLF